jgi:hypothetical protein
MKHVEVGVVECGPFTMAIGNALAIFRSWREAKKKGLPCNKWYGVYIAGSDEIVAQMGPFPDSPKIAEILTDAINNYEA